MANPQKYAHVAPRLTIDLLSRLQARQASEARSSINAVVKVELEERLGGDGCFGPVLCPPSSAVKTDLYLDREIYERVRALADASDAKVAHMLFTILAAPAPSPARLRPRLRQGSAAPAL